MQYNTDKLCTSSTELRAKDWLQIFAR